MLLKEEGLEELIWMFEIEQFEQIPNNTPALFAEVAEIVGFMKTRFCKVTCEA